MLLAGFILFILLIAGIIGVWYYRAAADSNPNNYDYNEYDEPIDSGLPLPSAFYDIPASLNPLNKNITPYVSSGYANIPRNDDLIWYHPWTNASRAGYSYSSLMNECDAAFYGTVQEVQPSVWSTSSGKEPFSLSITQPGKGGFGDETGFYEYNSIRVSGLDEIIYTNVVFNVDSWIKKPENVSGNDFVVEVEGGQVGKYVMVGTFYPSVWDLKEGDSYLIYVKYQNVMHPGLFVVLD
ncbi:MAG: hypothetical protein LBU81_02555 [Methanosarcinales archaeon]|jgi:hypothetical protein|nr:hypothetical protein [Methanosarcinales archaeon]